MFYFSHADVIKVTSNYDVTLTRKHSRKVSELKATAIKKGHTRHGASKLLLVLVGSECDLWSIHVPKECT